MAENHLPSGGDNKPSIDLPRKTFRYESGR